MKFGGRVRDEPTVGLEYNTEYQVPPAKLTPRFTGEGEGAPGGGAGTPGGAGTGGAGCTPAGKSGADRYGGGASPSVAVPVNTTPPISGGSATGTWIEPLGVQLARLAAF